MFAEFGRRFVADGAFGQIEDIYWLEKPEVEELANTLTRGVPLSDMAERIPARKKAVAGFS